MTLYWFAHYNRSQAMMVMKISVSSHLTGTIMAIRSEFEEPWVKTAIAACAGAFMGVALYQSKKFWPRAK